MEWFQLVLPAAGMCPALMQYLEGMTQRGLSSCLPDCARIEQDFDRWLRCCWDEMLGVQGEQRFCWLIFDEQDCVVGVVLLSPYEKDPRMQIELSPDCPKDCCHQILQQLDGQLRKEKRRA